MSDRHLSRVDRFLARIDDSLREGLAVDGRAKRPVQPISEARDLLLDAHAALTAESALYDGPRPAELQTLRGALTAALDACGVRPGPGAVALRVGARGGARALEKLDQRMAKRLVPDARERSCATALHAADVIEHTRPQEADRLRTAAAACRLPSNERSTAPRIVRRTGRGLVSAGSFLTRLF